MSREQHEITGFRGPVVENEAKIVDLRDFFKNTRYCGKTCIKIAYMVKFEREEGMLRPFFSCTGLFEKRRRIQNQIIIILYFCNIY